MSCIKFGILWAFVLIFCCTCVISEDCNTAARTCDECNCLWCKDPLFNDGGRCDSWENLMMSGCRTKHLISKASSLTIHRSEPLRDTMNIQPQNVAVNLPNNETVEMSVRLRVPRRKFGIKVRHSSDITAQLIPDSNVSYSRVTKHRLHQLIFRRMTPGTDMVVTLKLKPISCVSKKSKVRVTTGGQSKLVIKVAQSCGTGCACRDKKRFSKKCSKVGEYECGVCRCPAGYTGTQCQHSTGEGDMRFCRATEDAPVCSGVGKCEFGACVCPSPHVAGQYCECDDTACDFYNDTICGGRGWCRCGQCDCDQGYTGDACECTTSTDECLDSNGLLCGGKGECRCGVCHCHEHYLGKKCEICTDLQGFSSEKCNHHGDLYCGKCQCHEGYSGESCQISDMACVNPMAQESVACSGRGSCVAGMCMCHTRQRGGHTKYSGQFCQCDDFACDFHNQLMCGGRGRCVCGRCACDPGYTGTSCECPMSADECMDQNGRMCSYHGNCVCGRCECEYGYKGQYCNELDYK